ncbi:MAG: ribonuclease III [Fidelibacterota bacterium]|nr:MAG: ribonuclease III [Candidatus Neomarinimicrobiota bacterium]
MPNTVTFFHHLLPFLKRQPGSHTRNLEKRLGHRFKNHNLLEQALTHRSVTDSSNHNFERLEFLGDAVLSHVVSDHLYANYHDETEGELTLKRSAFVSKKFLANIGEELGIHHFLQVDSGVRLSDAKVRRNLVGDAMEALIGAVYLDGGMPVAERFITRELLGRETEAAQLVNHKGHLIELCHQHDLGNPRFQLLKTKGPEHDKRFVVQVRIGTRTFESAQANNKKAAEQEAAGLALEVLKQEIN